MQKSAPAPVRPAQNPRLTHNQRPELSHANLKECSSEASIMIALKRVRQQVKARGRTATTREKGAQQNP
jgi:hypothetical protein